MRSFQRFGAILLLSTIAATQAVADDFEFASDKTFSSYEARLDNLDCRLKKVECADHCCSTPGMVAGAELVLARVFGSDNGMRGHDYEFAPRLWLGWQGANGVGARVRWFEYFEANPASPDDSDLHVMTFDVEATSTLPMGSNWRGLLSGGIRYAEYDELDEGGGPVLGKHGAGPLIGAELHRNLSYRLNMYGIVREAIIFGNGINTFSPGADDYEIFAITEIQLGVEWNRALAGTARLFARAGVEGQFYHQVGDDDEEAFGLFGGILSVGILR